MKETLSPLLPIFLLILMLPKPAFPAGNKDSSIFHRVFVGILVHDRGPTSDAHEDGVDPNLEIQFNVPDDNFWKKVGSPYPTIGITPNFYGHTSIAYGGLTYDWDMSPFFLAGSIGVAVHDGPLHKDRAGCLRNSDCGFGWRILPHLSVESGYNIGKNYGISLFYDHMSHREILPGENEGIDHIGLRYFYTFR